MVGPFSYSLYKWWTARDMMHVWVQVVSPTHVQAFLKPTLFIGL